MRQQACTAKDNRVSLAATIKSMLGAFLHLMQDDPRAHRAIERVHAAIEHAQVAVWLSEDVLQVGHARWMILSCRTLSIPS